VNKGDLTKQVAADARITKVAAEVLGRQGPQDRRRQAQETTGRNKKGEATQNGVAP